MDNLAYTLCQRRSTLDWREAVSACSPTELSEIISSGTSEPMRPSGPPKLGFVFTGQGAQWHAMGRELHCYPIFARCMQNLDGYLKEFGADWSLLGKCVFSGIQNGLTLRRCTQQGSQVVTCRSTIHQPACDYRHPDRTCRSAIIVEDQALGSGRSF